MCLSCFQYVCQLTYTSQHMGYCKCFWRHFVYCLPCLPRCAHVLRCYELVLVVWSCVSVLRFIHNHVWLLDTNIFASVFQFLFVLAYDATQASGASAVTSPHHVFRPLNLFGMPSLYHTKSLRQAFQHCYSIQAGALGSCVICFRGLFHTEMLCTESTSNYQSFCQCKKNQALLTLKKINFIYGGCMVYAIRHDFKMILFYLRVLFASLFRVCVTAESWRTMFPSFPHRSFWGIFVADSHTNHCPLCRVQHEH